MKQRWNQRGSRGIGHGQHKVGVGRGGIKAVRGQHAFELLQGLAHRGPQGQGARRGLHTLTVAYQQLIAYGFTQTPQRIADRRLGKGQFVGGTRQAALGHHFVEDAQQVQVQCAEVKSSHWVYLSLVVTEFTAMMNYHCCE